MASIRREYSHDLVAAEALRFIRSSRQAPFFLYLALTIPHANNEAGKLGMEVPDWGVYEDLDWPEAQKGHAAMITRMDRDVGRLFDLLRELELDEDTVVFFSSDNGPHREGGNDPDFNDSNAHLRGIKRDLYEGGIRVPLIVRWPGRVPPGTICDLPTDFADFSPTAAEIARLERPADVDGVSIFPSLLGEPQRQIQRSHLYWEFYERGGARALRQGKWKAVRQPWHADVELYNLELDPGEKNDLAGQHPALVDRFRELMEDSHESDENWRIPKAR